MSFHGEHQNVFIHSSRRNYAETAADRFGAQLAELFGRTPVRVLPSNTDYMPYPTPDDEINGVRLSRRPIAWNGRQSHSNYTTEQTEAEGITIVPGFNWSGNRRVVGQFPSLMTDDSAEYFDNGATYFRGNLREEDGPQGWVPYTLQDRNGDNRTVGHVDVESRTITIQFPWNGMCDYHPYGFDMRTLFGNLLGMLDPEWLARHLEEEQDRARTQFAELVASRDTARITQLESDIATHEQLYSTSQQQMQVAERSLRELNAQHAAVLEMLNRDNNTDADAEWSAIERHVNVESIKLEGANKLAITTNNLMLPDPVGEREPAILGQFKIVLDFENESVNMLNLTNKKGQHDHPHVRNGSFCAGSWQPTVDDLMRQRELAAAVNFVIDTLSHCNPSDSWGQSYRHWFTDDNNDVATGQAA